MMHVIITVKAAFTKQARTVGKDQFALLRLNQQAADHSTLATDRSGPHSNGSARAACAVNPNLSDI